MAQQHNNFDFIRLMAATMVLVSHQYAIGGLPEPALLGDGLGGVNVKVFFAISGYLVIESWFRDPSLARFLARRALRIWPGLTVMVLLTVLALGPAVTTWSLRDYFSSSQTWAYLRAIKVFALGGHLPGVFEGMPLNGWMNASLWSLPVEVRCYLLLAGLGLAGLLRRRWTLPLLWLGAVVYCHAQADPGVQFVYSQYFLAGALMSQARRYWVERAPQVFVGAVALAGLLTWLGQAGWAELLAVPVASISLGSMSTPVLRRFGRFGDISYGVYIYAFPIQQTVTQFGVRHAGWSFETGLLVAGAATYLLGLLSWHGVEKQALKFKPSAPKVRSAASAAASAA